MFIPSVEQWRSRVRTYAAEKRDALGAVVRRSLPVEFLLAWMWMESAGRPEALGSQYEVGLFQINMADGPAFGGNIDTLHRNFAPATEQRLTRQLTDAEKDLQVTTGLNMVDAYRTKSESQLAAAGASWPQGSSDFWSLVKLQHALPAIPYSFLKAYRAEKGAPPPDWKTWATWLNGLSAARVSSISSAVGHYYGSNGKPALTRFTSNAEKAGNYGGVEFFGGLVSATMLALIVFAGALCAITLATAA